MREVTRLTIEQLGRLSKTMASVGEICDYTEIAIDALEKRDKYRWHDLRKNPEDLPRDDGLYCIAIKYDCYESAEVGFGQRENMYGYGSGWSAVMPNYGDIIAWRYIEPFEEVE